jgi:transposase-like protein
VPKPFPKEFRRDVIAVARQGDQSIAQVARSFGVSESCLARWLKIADREDNVTGAASSAGASGGGPRSSAGADHAALLGRRPVTCRPR